MRPQCVEAGIQDHEHRTPEAFDPQSAHLQKVSEENVRALHVAAMPFPTPQGTQASIHAMLSACVAFQFDVTLLTYGCGDHGEGVPYAHTRLPDFPRLASFRSGPSWRKAALDLRLISRIRAVTSRRLVIAHHVEAALAAYLSRADRWIFFAHTALGPEMPAYVPSASARLFERAGESLDSFLATRASAVAAVSPALASRIKRLHAVPAIYVPVPWNLPEPISTEERRLARASLEIGDDEYAVLYAGNLDRYQGWEVVLRALVGMERPVFLLATESDPKPACELCGFLGIPFRLLPLAKEPDRRRAHAAADLAAVPRALEGGVPIKLLDALARGVPVATTDLAASGLRVEASIQRVADHHPDAFAEAIRACRRDPRRTETLRASGRDYIRSEHSCGRFAETYGTLIRTAVSNAASTQPFKRYFQQWSRGGSNP